MRRRIFIACVMAAALCGGAEGARTRAQGAQQPQPTPHQQQQPTPSDRVAVEELKALLAAGGRVLVLDVRYGIDAKIKGATHITLDQLESRLTELPRDREIITYCS
jgi:hypothetical protein